jgi:two-component system, OmpR family, KDP operon response regulator KdpE
MAHRPDILVVDDEAQILRVLKASLDARGYDVRTARNGLEALEAIDRKLPELMILDLVMPEMSGLEVCRDVRRHAKFPILVLSAKGAEGDKVAALDAGADDYVTKPFGMDELLARVRAVLRRMSPADAGGTTLTVGDVVIDTAERRVTVAGHDIKVTPKEYEAMKYFVANAGKVLTHRTLLQTLWGWQSADQTEYLRVLVNQLRKKIEPDPQKPRYIVTEPWVGYRFVPRGEDE